MPATFRTRVSVPLARYQQTMRVQNEERTLQHLRPSILTLVFTASLLLWASIVGTPATAATVTPVTFAYTGTVTDITFGLLDGTSPFGSSPYVPGSLLITGLFTFNSSSPNLSAHPRGFYQNPILSHTVQLRDLSNAVIYNSPLATTPNNFIHIRTGVQELFQPTPSDTLAIYLGTIPGSAINGNPIVDASISLTGEQGIFNSVELFTTPPSISSFNRINQMVFSFVNQNSPTGGGVIIGTIKDMTPSPVPLPPAIILFGAGLVALVGLGARSRLQKKLGLA